MASLSTPQFVGCFGIKMKRFQLGWIQLKSNVEFKQHESKIVEKYRMRSEERRVQLNFQLKQGRRETWIRKETTHQLNPKMSNLKWNQG